MIKKVLILIVTVLVTFLTGCSAKLPMPEVKEGRFNFSVTYEVSGEQKTYSGVYVCKYQGVVVTLVGGHIEWEDYVENENDVDIPIHTNDDGVIYINLGFFPEYFMSDPYADTYNKPSPNLYMVYNDSEPDSLNITSDEEVIANYGVKIISYEYADPIENNYEEKLGFGRFEPSIN